MLSVTWSVSHQLGYPASSAARVIAACSQLRLNSKSCPESVRRYGNSSLNATMVFIDCDVSCTRSRRWGSWRCFGWKQLSLKQVRPYPSAKDMNGIHKLIHILKALVY